VAGQNGLGCLGLTIWVDLPELQERMKRYRDGLKKCKPAGAFINNQVGVFTIAHCATSTKAAVENGAVDAAMWYVTYVFKALASVPKEMLGKIPGTLPYQDIVKQFPLIERWEKEGKVTFEEVDERDMVIVGDPDKCVEKLKKYEKAGADHVLCIMQVGGLAHQHVMESIELFGKYVIPQFKN
jgi:alkanesulfonate monooxygenase SsuD/methylene tetrahydromethanopterin reductase-like flavin-dependent oxidoreductase (luciferase family)